MRKLWIGLLSAVVALAIVGGAGAQGGSGNHPSNHGADVSNAAHTCPTGNGSGSGATPTTTGTATGGSTQNHGQCVSAIAKKNGNGAGASTTPVATGTATSGTTTGSSKHGKHSSKTKHNTKTKHSKTKKTKTNTSKKH
jgi:hypothetical protein